ncbi:MAG: hypothetical protein ACYDIC_07005 [Desulfobaccales bacterium]
MRKLTWWEKFLVLLALNLALSGLASAQPTGAPAAPGAPAAGPRTIGAQPAGVPSAVPRATGAPPAGSKPAGAPSPVAKPAVPKVSPPGPPAGFTDYGSFLAEFQAAGAFKFYDNTEAILRLANFEQALMRYRFLKGQIQGKVDYHGLMASVNRRIQFLQRQLHLRDSDVAAIPARKVRTTKLKPAVKLPETKPPEKPEAAKPIPPGEAGPEAQKPIPPVTATPAPPAQVPSAAAPLPPAQVPAAVPPPADQKRPAVVTTDTKPKEDEKAEEEKDKEEKPAVPPNFWQRMRIKLHLGKKPDSAGDKKADSVTIE